MSGSVSRSLCRTAAVALALLLVAPSSARASDLDKFLEAHQSGDWAAAEKAWGNLEVSMEPRGTHVVLKHVEVLVRLGKRDAARSETEEVLGREPRNVIALALLARLRVGESSEVVKGLLLDAAREGYPVLRELRGSKELQFLHDDPSFVLAAMRAASQFDALHERGRNPFASPRFSVVEPKPPEPRFVKSVAKEPRKRLADYINQGNAFLRTMAQDLREEKLAEVSLLLVDVKGLCDEMRRETEVDFTRNADELWLRATRLEAEAKKLQRVKELGVVVTGVVVSPRVPSRAIVALGKEGGRIYEVGDELRDASGQRVRGLKVSRIVEGSVGFSYDGIDFVRELRRSP